MEENRPQFNRCENCSGQCCHGHGGMGGWNHQRYTILRWMLGALILAAVFAIGVKVGEFKMLFADHYRGYGNMRGNMMYDKNIMMGSEPRMFRLQTGVQEVVPVPLTATTTPATKTK